MRIYRQGLPSRKFQGDEHHRSVAVQLFATQSATRGRRTGRRWRVLAFRLRWPLLHVHRGVCVCVCVYWHVCVWDIHVSTHARLRALRQALCLEHAQALESTVLATSCSKPWPSCPLPRKGEGRLCAFKLRILSVWPASTCPVRNFNAQSPLH